MVSDVVERSAEVPAGRELDWKETVTGSHWRMAPNVRFAWTTACANVRKRMGRIVMVFMSPN